MRRSKAGLPSRETSSSDSRRMRAYHGSEARAHPRLTRCGHRPIHPYRPATAQQNEHAWGHSFRGDRLSLDYSPAASLAFCVFLLELLELVLQLPDLLLTEVLLLLVLLQLLLEILDRLLGLPAAQALRLVHRDLVTGPVDHVFVVGCLLHRLLAEHEFTLLTQPPRLHDPLLRADAVAELLVVANDHDAPLVVLEAAREPHV